MPFGGFWLPGWVFGTGRRAPGRRWARGGGRPGTARWLCRPQMIVPMQCHAGMPVECPQLRWQGCGPGPRSSRLPGGSPVPPGPSTALPIGGEGHQYRYKSSAVTQCLSTSPLPQSRESHALCRCGRDRATPNSGTRPRERACRSSVFITSLDTNCARSLPSSGTIV